MTTTRNENVLLFLLMLLSWTLGYSYGVYKEGKITDRAIQDAEHIEELYIQKSKNYKELVEMFDDNLIELNDIKAKNPRRYY